MQTLALIMAFSLFGGAAAFAQQDDGPPPGDGQHHRPPPLPLETALDTNHDGIIDAAEIAKASAELKTLDKNGDGQLTPDEYMPHRPDGTSSEPPPGPDGRMPPAPPLLRALDTNGDGIIDANEIANAPAELKTLDKNGDGQLTPDEYRPKHRHPPGPPPDDDAGGPPPGGQGPDGSPPPGPPPDAGQ